jgi:NO-binding membrane sensor protein with MHYT domain
VSAATSAGEPTNRLRVLVTVELGFAALSLAAAVALTFSLGPVARATNQTTVHLVGAALFALACGAVAAARDPAGNRTVVWIEIVFTSMCALELVRKLVVDEGGRATTWLLLGALVVGLALLVWVAPAAGRRATTERNAPRAGAPPPTP